MPRIIDLDLIGPPPVTIRKRVDGEPREYTLPGDPPVHVWLAVTDAYDNWARAEGDEAAEAVTALHDRMLDLFRIEQPDLDRLPFGPTGMYQVLAGFYGGIEDDEPQDPPGADEAASTTKTTSGRASSPARKPKTTTRSRSSR